MRALFFSLSLFVAILAGGAANAEKRVALVIGNNEYTALTPAEQLQKAVNDADAVGDALQEIGFTVIRGSNVTRSQLSDLLFEFTEEVGPGDTAFFFFAGHGVAIGGGNYLLPVDVPAAQPGEEKRVIRGAIAEHDIIGDLSGRGAAVSVVVIDACRNNPFAKTGTRALGDGMRGLTRPPEDRARGIFGIYSAGIGETALDRLGDDDPNPNSVFTRVLVPTLKTPGLSLIDIAYEVNGKVADMAKGFNHDQNPAFYDQARGRDVILLRKAEEPPPVVVVDPPKDEGPATDDQAAAADCSAAEAHFQTAKELNMREALQDHVDRFGSCSFASLANMLIARIDAQAKSDAGPAPEPEPEPLTGTLGDPAALAAECDRLAGDPDDPGRPGGIAGVADNAIDAAAAVAACQAATAADPSPRLAHQFARALFTSGKDKEAVTWFQKAADANYAAAAGQLATLYKSGLGVGQDSTRAVEFFRKAADQGLPIAQYKLGLQYLDGDGVGQSDADAFTWVLKAADQGNADAQNFIGLWYDDGRGTVVVKDDAKGAEYYRKAADQGLAVAQYNIGIEYLDGDGVEQSDAEAIRWLQLAADQGNADAENRMGLFYDTGRGVTLDDVKAVEYYRKAAEKDLVVAQYNLGYMYLDGEGVARSDRDAFEWISKAAAQGHADALNRMGLWYDDGFADVVVKDDAKGADHYRQAADKGLAVGQYNLAIEYIDGDGVPQSNAEAFAWMTKAADQGYGDAENYIGLWYDDGLAGAVAKDDAKGAEHYRKAADKGVAVAQYNLAIEYMDGDGVPQSDAEAYAWMLKAADQGYASAQNRVGLFYDSGKGVTKDDAKAVEYFRKAADQGLAVAQYNLGFMYLDGEGVAKSDTEALVWMEKAADQGHTDAQYKAARLYLYSDAVPQDLTRAASNLEKAATADHADAKALLARFHDKGVGGYAANAQKAAELLVDAYSRQSAEAKTLLVEKAGEALEFQTRSEIQRLLQGRGLYSGAIDGAFGPGTTSALDKTKSS